MSIFHRLWGNHPTGKFPCSTDGKSHFENQCAIRMGVAITKSGISMKTWGLRQCWHHDKDEGHTLAAEEMANALTRVIVPGMKRVEKHQAKEAFDKITGRKGIVFIKDFYNGSGDHIDLWNGWRMTKLSSPFAVYLGLGSDYTRGAGIWFWEVA
ncbi:type VI secretion system amidase effector protein Tae4 [Schlegelella sp. S2-27]|uniref:Type VI secretion system amidase effector protein Tae4 n=1 Tax=Caldimonas mangrovi TaxID=2944811 RepID=A0ABT0YP52_9BURK|nr:T6SS effector amidase Tae4 family protein [Caldimonas mangrovi]MCM5680443.1 type VI secretion system amidase effector protein Tae4 [Caldimonas mangrovi]